VYVPTCFDGIQNQGETGIDCGGPCEPCKIIEQPRIIQEVRDNLWVVIASSLLVLLLILFVLYRIFRKSIKKFFVRLGWKLAGRYHRLVLLEKSKTEDLLQKLYHFEKILRKSPSKQFNKRTLELASLTRSFFKEALKVPYEFREEELVAKLDASFKSYKMIKKMLLGLFRSVNAVEFNRRSSTFEELHLFVEELIQLVYIVSKPQTTKHRESKQKRVKGVPTYRKLLLDLANVEIALQYREIVIAKNKFLEVVSQFEMLPEKEKGYIYDHMNRVNEEIMYHQGLIEDED
jgi:hypothetical protein